MFANFHRLRAETYKAMELNSSPGRPPLMAEYNGIEKKAHVREAHLAGDVHGGRGDPGQSGWNTASEPGSDLVYPNPMIANICKFYCR